MFKDFSILIKYSLIGQILNFSLYPVLTYLYTPAEFALFNYYYFGTMFFSLLIGFSQEFYIINLKNKRLIFFQMVVIIKRYILIFPFLVLFLLISYYFNKIKVEYLFIIFLSYLGAIILTIYNSFCEIYIKYGKIKNNAILRFSFNVLPNLVKTIFGIIQSNLIIIYSDFFMKLFVCKDFIILLFNFFKKNKNDIAYNKEIKTLKKNNKEFNKYYPFDNFLNVVNGIIYLPFFGFLFGNENLGIISFCFSLLYVPVSIFTTSFKDLYRNKILNKIKENENLLIFTTKYSIIVFIFGFFVFFSTYVMLPYVFQYIFSAEWNKVLQIYPYLIPLFFFNFFSMSFSGVLIIIDNFKISFYYQIFNSLLTFSVFTFFYFYKTSLLDALFIFSLIKSISYILYYFVMIITISNYKGQLNEF